MRLRKRLRLRHFLNMDSQLRTVGESSDIQQGLGSILSPAGPREVFYEDLIRNIEITATPMIQPRFWIL